MSPTTVWLFVAAATVGLALGQPWGPPGRGREFAPGWNGQAKTPVCAFMPPVAPSWKTQGTHETLE